MKVTLNIQKDGVNTLGDALDTACDLTLKKVYVVCGDIKESGFNKICEFVKALKARKFFVIGIDKKNTTRRMLETYTSYTKNVFVFNNNGESEFVSSTFILEYLDKAIAYIAPDSISQEMLYTDISMYTTIEWDLNLESDILLYKEYVNKVLEVAKLEEAQKIDDDVIAKLANDKQIFSTKQYTHNVMSISELMAKSGKTNVEKTETDNVSEVERAPIPKINLEDITDVDLDIDFGHLDADITNATVDEEVADVENEEDVKEIIEDEQEHSDALDFEIEEEVTDLEGMLFETADISLGKVDKKKTDETITKSKRIDLKNVSNILMQLSSKPSKGKDVNCIKVPTYIKEMVPEFFKILDSAETTVASVGINQKQAKISIELIDVNSDKRYIDTDAYITYSSGQNNVCFVTSVLENVNYEESDIARIIKLSDNCYHIEIVPTTCEEYNLWNRLCTQNMRSSTRTYGLM